MFVVLTKTKFIIFHKYLPKKLATWLYLHYHCQYVLAPMSLRIPQYSPLFKYFGKLRILEIGSRTHPPVEHGLIRLYFANLLPALEDLGILTYNVSGLTW
jgi:hypothetical protein